MEEIAEHFLVDVWDRQEGIAQAGSFPSDNILENGWTFFKNVSGRLFRGRQFSDRQFQGRHFLGGNCWTFLVNVSGRQLSCRQVPGRQFSGR